MHLFTSHNSTSLWLYINFVIPRRRLQRKCCCKDNSEKAPTGT
jgi:hypothetical protein